MQINHIFTQDKRHKLNALSRLYEAQDIVFPSQSRTKRKKLS